MRSETLTVTTARRRPGARPHRRVRAVRARRRRRPAQRVRAARHRRAWRSSRPARAATTTCSPRSTICCRATAGGGTSTVSAGHGRDHVLPAFIAPSITVPVLGGGCSSAPGSRSAWSTRTSTTRDADGAAELPAWLASLHGAGRADDRHVPRRHHDHPSDHASLVAVAGDRTRGPADARTRPCSSPITTVIGIRSRSA